MKKVLILGATGQLGSDITECLDESYENYFFSKSELNIVNRKQVKDYLFQIRPDIVINCSAYVNVENAEDDEEIAFNVNAIGVKNIAEAVKQISATLYHISTDYIFNGKTDIPYTEDSVPEPINVYGNSKLSGEFFVKSTIENYFIFRVSSLFGSVGASGKGGNFVETMIRLAKEGKPLRVIDDQYMSPTHTLDIAKVIKTFIDLNVKDYGTYHCSGEGFCSWYEFAKEIFNQLGINPDLTAVSHQEYKTKAKRPEYSVLDNSKLNRIFYMPYWKDSLREYLSIKGHI